MLQVHTQMSTRFLETTECGWNFQETSSWRTHTGQSRDGDGRYIIDSEGLNALQLAALLHPEYKQLKIPFLPLPYWATWLGILLFPKVPPCSPFLQSHCNFALNSFMMSFPAPALQTSSLLPDLCTVQKLNQVTGFRPPRCSSSCVSRAQLHF